MDEKTRKICWEILEDRLGEDYKSDLAHGIPHVERVYRDFILLKNSSKLISENVLEALEYAVIFHDIGRKKQEDGEGEHPKLSSDILKELFKKELSGIGEEKQKWILFSVANHSKKIEKGSAFEEEWLCYSLLTLLDHMDAIGLPGIYRPIILKLEIPLLPKSMSSCKQAEFYLNNPLKITEEDQGKMRENSILEHIVSNYCVAYKDFLPRIEKFLPPSFRGEVEKRLDLSKSFVLDNLKIIKNL